MEKGNEGDGFNACCGSYQSSLLYPSLPSPLHFDRESSGADRAWTVGTELLQPFLYDDEVASPEALRETLFDDVKRAQYVASTEHEGTDNENGKFELILYDFLSYHFLNC